MTKRICSIDECEKPHYGKGFCAKHYKADHHRRHIDRAKANQAAWDAAHADFIREYSTKYYRANAEKIKARSKEWAASNAERKRESDRVWRENNVERKRQNDAAWRASDPERNKRSHAEYYQANRERQLAQQRARRAAMPELYAAQRRALRDANPEEFLSREREYCHKRRANARKRIKFADILERDGMFCHICKTNIESMSDLHFDHVIPLSKGGPHTADNIKPAHAFCNLSKGAQILTD